MSVIKLTDGRQMSYEQYGDLDGYPVLFCHGTPGSRLQLTEAMAQIAGSLNVRIIAPDRPGCGYSDMRQLRGFSDWAGDVAALMDELGLGQFKVMGYSMGAPFALACAYALSERVAGVSLVGGLAPNLFDPQVSSVLSPASNMIFTMARDNASSLADTLKTVVPDGGALFAALSEPLPAPDKALLACTAFQQDCVECLRQGHETAANEYILAARDWGFPLEEVSAQTQLWCGTDDINTPPPMTAYLAERLPHSQTQYLQAAGHLCLFSHWREILAALFAGGTQAPISAPVRASFS